SARIPWEKMVSRLSDHIRIHTGGERTLDTTRLRHRLDPAGDGAITTTMFLQFTCSANSLLAALSDFTKLSADTERKKRHHRAEEQLHRRQQAVEDIQRLQVIKVDGKDVDTRIPSLNLSSM